MHQTAYAPYSLYTRQFIHQFMTVYTPDSLYTMTDSLYTRQFMHQTSYAPYSLNTRPVYTPVYIPDSLYTSLDSYGQD